jgi:hypothetical protein
VLPLWWLTPPPFHISCPDSIPKKERLSRQYRGHSSVVSSHPLLGIAHFGNIVGFVSGINGTKVPLGLIRTVEGPVVALQKVTVADSKVTAEALVMTEGNFDE